MVNSRLGVFADQEEEMGRDKWGSLKLRNQVSLLSMRYLHLPQEENPVSARCKVSVDVYGNIFWESLDLFATLHCEAIDTMSNFPYCKSYDSLLINVILPDVERWPFCGELHVFYWQSSSVWQWLSNTMILTGTFGFQYMHFRVSFRGFKCSNLILSLIHYSKLLQNFLFLSMLLCLSNYSHISFHLMVTLHHMSHYFIRAEPTRQVKNFRSCHPKKGENFWEPSLSLSGYYYVVSTLYIIRISLPDTKYF